MSHKKRSKPPIYILPYDYREPIGATTPEKENERVLIRIANSDIIEVRIIDRTLDNKYTLVKYGNGDKAWKETGSLEIVHTFPEPKKQGTKVLK